ncbi:MAG: hypothetical protein CMN28_15935 [Salinisphaeraceae bacterium]|nr:hypothetical protein [Salinisphaeraceae bacterium]
MSENDTSFGIFYPTHHVVAVLPDDDAAQRGAQALEAANVPQAEISRMKADAVARDIEEKEADKGWMDQLKEAMSIGVGTEGQFWQQDLDMAREGAGFLVIRCDSDERADTIKQTLAEEKPRSLRYYQRLAIQNLLIDVPG